MPSSRATARSDRPAAPTEASCRRAASVISAVSSARTRSRAVGGTGRVCRTRAVHTSESIALDMSTCEREHLSHSRALLSLVEEDAVALHVIVGKGPVGTTTAQALVARGEDV